MILYHGTSVDSARRIAKEGFRYGVKYNWIGKQRSKEGFVYLSLAYAPFYAMTSKSTSKMRAIVKVSVPMSALYPDEDFLFHVLHKPIHEIDITEYKHLARNSLDYMGNAAARPEKIKVIGHSEFNSEKLILVCDPVISPMAYKIMSDYYKKLTDWIYKGNDPLKFKHFMFRPNPKKRRPIMNPEIRTATHTGYSYGGKPVYIFDNEYWYMASKHRKMSAALDLNKKHPAHIRKTNGWYGRFYQLPVDVARKIK